MHCIAGYQKYIMLHNNPKIISQITIQISHILKRQEKIFLSPTAENLALCSGLIDPDCLICWSF